MVEQSVVQQVKHRPDQIRNQDGAEAALHKAFIIEALAEVQIVEKPEG